MRVAYDYLKMLRIACATQAELVKMGCNTDAPAMVVEVVNQDEKAQVVEIGCQATKTTKVAETQYENPARQATTGTQTSQEVEILCDHRHTRIHPV